HSVVAKSRAPEEHVVEVGEFRGDARGDIGVDGVDRHRRRAAAQPRARPLLRRYIFLHERAPGIALGAAAEPPRGLGAALGAGVDEGFFLWPLDGASARR